ncbi:DUF3320 domain-containing protein [Devosia alba]|uniref:DUF3320 domain-containing protein n=1 Tax=Devosia alba TaxID=3152360 RepID=UPI003266E65A
MFHDLTDHILAQFVVLRVEPHEAPLNTMGSVVQKIIDVEGPIHIDEGDRRAALLFGKQETGSRIVTAVGMGTCYLRRGNARGFQ